jgi:hypothetical protein
MLIGSCPGVSSALAALSLSWWQLQAPCFRNLATVFLVPSCGVHAQRAWWRSKIRAEHKHSISPSIKARACCTSEELRLDIREECSGFVAGCDARACSICSLFLVLRQDTPCSIHSVDSCSIKQSLA